MLRLQIKDAGSWRNVVSFSADQRIDVMKAGSDLLATQSEKVSMRVTDGETTLYTCAGPNCIWRLEEAGKA